jgi:hypothetical protein
MSVTPDSDDGGLEPDTTEAIRAAMDAAGAYMDAFNARDQEAMADTINFPHVRMASGTVTVWQTREDSMIDGLFDWLKQTEGWHHSEWRRREVIHARSDKVHLDVEFVRCAEDGAVLGSYPSIWVITDNDGHWGIQARSSFAA